MIQSQLRLHLWSVPFDKLRAGFRGRFAAPEDEVVGRRTMTEKDT
jgi:hypothetical protein